LTTRVTRATKYKTLLLGAALIACTLPALAEAVPSAGILKGVRGEVVARDAAGNERRLTSGDAVFARERVSAGKGAGAAVMLRDSTLLILGENSQLDLASYTFDATEQSGSMAVRLLRGALRVITGVLGRTSADSVRISTRSVTIGIRGTDFIVETEGE
jgi:hypothetical protein